MTSTHDDYPASDHGGIASGADQPPHVRYPAADPETTTSGHESETHHGHHGGHGGHGIMMLVCCIPMIVIAVLLVSTGVAGSGALLGALLCVAMMAVMMFAMPGGHRHK